MSRKKARTPLRGCGNPIFPKGIESLNNTFNQLEINSRGKPNLAILRDIGKICPVFKELRKDIKTKDGYIWPAGLCYRGNNKQPTAKSLKKRLIIVFPFLGDKDAKGGIDLDRSIAVYAHGPVLLRTAEFYVKTLSAEMKRIIRIFQARIN